MIQVKAEKHNFLLSVLAFSFLLILALACGGGGSSSSNGILINEVSGTLDDSTIPSALSKPRRFPATANLAGTAFSLDDPSETWPLSFPTTSSYSVNIIRKSNVKIEIYLDSQLILSRFHTSAETDSNSLNSPINTITHLQSRFTQFFIDQSSTTTTDQAMQNANLQLFGDSSPNINELSLDNLNTHNPEIAAITSTYGQLFQFVDFEDIREALALINSAMLSNTASVMSESYLDLLNDLSDETAITTLVEAHETAKNATGNPVDPLTYVTISNQYNSTLLNTAFNLALVPPSFPDLDTANEIGVGILFNYDFPEASTEDRQGLSSQGYTSIWLSTPPTGLVDSTGNNGLNLKFIPSSEDLGQTFEYQVSIKGANGTGPVTKNLELTVNDSEIIPNDRKALYDIPVAGPVGDDDYIYLVTHGDDGTFLDKYLQSDIQVQGGSLFLDVSRWLIPEGYTDVQDITLANNTIYLAGDNGIYGFDSSFSGINTGLATYYTDTIASEISILNDQIFALDTSSTPVLRMGNLQLDSLAEVDTHLSAIASSGNVTMAAFNDDYLYITGNSLISAYTFSRRDEFVQTDELITSHFSYTIVKQDAPITAPITLYNQSIAQYNITSNEFDLTSFTSTQISNSNIMVANGTYLYKIDDDQSEIISGHSLTNSEANLILSSEPDSNIYFDSLPENIDFHIYNVPEGSDGKSNAWIYTIGSSEKDLLENAYIRGHKIQPITP